MLRILLLSSVFILVSTTNYSDFQFKPEDITKESILKNHEKLFGDYRVNKTAAMAIISPNNPNGYSLTLKTHHLLSHISPTWFTVTLKITERAGKRLVDVKITGTPLVKTEWMHEIRRTNKKIKIVPEFKFIDTLTEKENLEILKNPLQAERIAIALHSHCESLGFDGLVLDMDQIALKWTDPDRILNGLETMEQIGRTLRRKKLVVILALNPPQKTETPKGFYAKLSITDNLECEKLSDQFDYVLLKTYEDAGVRNLLQSWELWAIRSTDCFGDMNKVMIGIRFHGFQFTPIDFDRENSNNAKLVDGDTYLTILSFKDSNLLFFEDAMTHTVTSTSANAVIVYPSLVSLEKRMKFAEKWGMSMAFFDYGMGLDYFTNIFSRKNFEELRKFIAVVRKRDSPTM